MIQSLKKEWFYAVRNYRILILMASFLFFAIMTPVLTYYILPEVLKSQFPGMDEQTVSEMLDLTQAGTLQSYLSDMFEIGSIIVVFTLCGLMAQEIRERTLVMALCSGRGHGAIVGAKFIVQSLLLISVAIVALSVSYAYSGLLFGFDLSYGTILVSALLQGGYLIFLMACLLCFGSFIARPIAAGIITLAVVYSSHLIASLFDLQKWLPTGLSDAAISFSHQDPALWGTLASGATLTALLFALTVLRLKTMEFKDR